MNFKDCKRLQSEENQKGLLCLLPFHLRISSPRNRLCIHTQSQKLCTFKKSNPTTRNSNKKASFKIQAAKVPAGVGLPKVEPKLQPPFLGFTRTAEIWNSRACMIGLIGTFIVELILNKGILELIGVDIGKGLDIPL